MSSPTTADRTAMLLAALARLAEGDYSIELDVGEPCDDIGRLGSSVERVAKRLRSRAEELDYLRFSIDQAPDGVFWVARDGRFSYVNQQACSSLGYSPNELEHLHVWDVDPDFPAARWPEHWERVRSAGRLRFETRHRRKDGSVFPVEISANFVQLGAREHHVAFARDISERMRAAEERASLSAQLEHAQKMESVGRLAGGVAHDFNNLLSVILSYSSMLSAELGADDPGCEDLTEITRAAQRAATLTRQLLGFSRRQKLDYRPLDLNEVVLGVSSLLERLVGENIELDLRLAPRLWRVRADRGQLEQVLMNLIINARDAMPRGGRIVVATTNMPGQDTETPELPEARDGHEVRMTVSDDGVGMDSETRTRAFDPFFTTKERGKGTGLGLSTVHGIVNQSGGDIFIRSELGRGTSVEIRFPRAVQATERPATTTSLPARTTRGTETILLVEDEPQVRQLAARILKRAGYETIVCADPAAALATCCAKPIPIHLLVTDLVLPNMNGRELGERIRQLWPDVTVVYMSGYTPDSGQSEVEIEPGAAFLQKPFTPAQLTRVVRTALDAAGPPIGR